MEQLLSFHNDKAVKAKYLTRVKEHAKADEIIKGQYWQGGKGCAVGCTIHSSNHQAYEQELGVPTWLARVEDRLFEGMPNADAKKFPIEFLKSIPIGITEVRFNVVKWKFLLFICQEAYKNIPKGYSPELKERCQKANEGVQKVLKNAIKKKKIDEQARSAAAYAAADAAADAAAYDAYAAYAAYADAAYAAAAYAAAAAAAAAADAAAYAAAAYDAAAYDAAAYAAARQKAYKKYAVKLLELLRDA